MGPTQLGEAEPGTVLSVAIGLILLFAAVFVSLGVYLETEIPLGIGTSHRAEVVEEPSAEREWLEVLLDEYSNRTEEAKNTNEVNGRWLGRAQTSMIIGVAYLLTSTVGLFTPLSATAVFLGSTMTGGVALLLYYLVLKPVEEP